MPTREQTDCLSLPLLPKKHTQAHSLWCLMAAGLWALPRGQGQAGLGRDVRQERRATFPPALQGDGHSGPSSHEWPETLVSICFQVSVLKEDAGERAGELPPEEQWGAGAEVPARPWGQGSTWGGWQRQHSTAGTGMAPTHFRADTKSVSPHTGRRPHRQSPALGTAGGRAREGGQVRAKAAAWRQWHLSPMRP